MRPSLEVGMPKDAAKSGPKGMTMTKSRMLTNCTAATSSTTARSRLSNFTGPFDAGAGSAGSNHETPDERHVVGLSEKRTRLAAGQGGGRQTHRAQRRARGETVGGDAQVEEAGGGERAGAAARL